LSVPVQLLSLGLMGLLGRHFLLGTVLLGPAEGFLLHPLLSFLGGFFGGLFRGMLVPEKQSQAQHCQDHQGQELMERGAGAVGPILFAEALYQEFLEFRKHGSIHPF